MLVVAAPRTLILGSDAAALGRLQATARTLSAARSAGLVFEELSGDVRSALVQRRELEPAARIGFVARDEHTAIEALEAGADEAQVFGTVDAQALNAFLDRLELRANQRATTKRLASAAMHDEKLATLGTLIAGIGHEINNPLSSVLMSLFVLRHRLLPAVDAARAIAHGETPSPRLLAALEPVRSSRRSQDVGALLEDVNAAAEAIAAIVRDLRIFARNDSHEAPELVEIPALIDHVLRLVGRSLASGAVLERDYAPDLPKVLVPRHRIAQALTNLLVNALQAIQEIERPVHVIRIHVRTDDEFMAIAIHDTGPGIPPEHLDRIFDPYFTTKRAELGTGLGLAISRAILRDLGGELTVESVHGQGASFICLVPVAPHDAMPSGAEQALNARPAVPKQGQRVLVVEDDPRVLRSYARVLGSEHQLLVAADAREAIEVLVAGPDPSLIVLELDLLSGDAAELVAWLEQHRSELLARTAIVAAFDAERRHGSLVQRFGSRVLSKAPLRGEALIELLARTTQGA